MSLGVDQNHFDIAAGAADRAREVAKKSRTALVFIRPVLGPTEIGIPLIAGSQKLILICRDGAEVCRPVLGSCAVLAGSGTGPEVLP